MRIAHEKEQKNREMELSELKSKIATLEQTTGMYNKKISGMKDEWTLKIQSKEIA